MRQRRHHGARGELQQPNGKYDGVDDKEQSRRSSGKQHTTPVPHALGLMLGFVAFYALGLSFVAYSHAWLPAPLPLDAPKELFSEARARVVLENIMSFGYHPVGTRANEELIPGYLVEEIKKIQASAGPEVLVELEVQRPSGAFGLDFLARFQNIYANVTNILVRVSPKNDPEALNNSLMLSSHYDAAIGGAAASDDGVNIAIMMEVLRVFALDPPKHGALVFNFNGAEETIMQAAHGFITQHPWTETIRAFINLEAAGAGGRELLFQTGSDELALAYAQGAKYPHASIIAQEVFQSGVIHADTDFRIYRDFGYVAGMDFAYIENGYVYHTELDDISRIQQGAVQRLGDNVVGVVNQLANQKGRLEKVAATPESSNTLFFDISGYTMVTMGKTTAFTICGAVFVAAVLYLLVSPISFRERLAALKFIGRCVCAGFAASLSTALVLSLFAPLAWYSKPNLGAVMFVFPVLTGMVDQLIKYLEKTTKAKNYNPSALWLAEESFFEAVLFLWVIGLGALISFGSISSYMMAVWVAFPLIGQIVCHALQRLNMLSTGAYVVISIGAFAVPVLHTAATSAVAFAFFIPLMGRSGTQLPPDLLVAVLFTFYVSVLVSYSGRFFCFFPVATLKQVRKACIAISIVTIVFASLRNPYTDDCPKRVMMQHVYRETVLPNGEVKSDSGLWLNALDYRGLLPLKPYLAATQWKDVSNMVAPQSLDENSDVYSFMPWALPVKKILPEKKSWYLPAAIPAVPKNLQWAKSIGNGVNGPVPESDESYILQFCTGTAPSNFHFWIEAESDRPIDAVIVGHFLDVLTPEMREFKDALPSWMTTMDGVSSWKTVQI
ncbi:Endoplasmic reticulum metallopeptidase 1, partial [Globisporangium splendens]